MQKFDLMTPQQKIFAGILAVGALMLLWFLLPPMIVILKNLWILGILSAPIIYTASNPKAVWGMFLNLSDKLTRWMISKDKKGYMYRFYDYIIAKRNIVQKARIDLNTVKIESIGAAGKLKTAIDRNSEEAINLEQKLGKDHSEVRIRQHKVAIDTKRMDDLVPKIEGLTVKEKLLLQIEEQMTTDAEMYKYQIDSLIEQHNIDKKMSSASDAARQAMGSDSEERKLFDEAVKQMEQEASKYLANIEDFQRTILPKLAAGNVMREISEEEGAKLIADFKANKLQLTNEKNNS